MEWLAQQSGSGGGLNMVARHGVAALLSAAHPNVYFVLTEAEVINYVQAADGAILKTPLNER